MGNENNRCGIPHIAYQQLKYPVTGISIAVTENNHVTGIHDPVTGISISVTGNNHVTGIHEYACTNPINHDLCNRNKSMIHVTGIHTINACIPASLYNSGVRT